MKAQSSFRGGVSYAGSPRPGVGKVIIASQEVLVHESDPGLSVMRVTPPSKPTFLVLGQTEEGKQVIVAVYHHPKSDMRLVLSIRPLIASGRITHEDLADWDPDYLLRSE